MHLAMLITIIQCNLGLPSSFVTYKRLKLKLKVFSAGHIVVMFNYYVAQLRTATCSSMTRQCFDSINRCGCTDP